MSRLTAAFERAQRLPEAPTEVGPAAVPWALDHAAAQPQAEPPARRDPPARLSFDASIEDRIAVGEHADGMLVEQYRRLAAVLHHAGQQQNLRSVMISSAVPSEGKTLTATNLALTLSQSYERRVLLIDADLRRPSVHQIFRLPNHTGLGDCLRATVSVPPVRTVSPTLRILTAGQPTADPMSALVSGNMRQLLADAVQQFDFVIIDTPPVGLLPDANLLSNMVDGVLMVVSAGSTPYPAVRRAVDALGAAHVLGVVFNRVAKDTMAHAYGSYGYYYGKERSTDAPAR